MSLRMRVRRHGLVCTRMSSKVDDREGTGESSQGQRRPREHGEEETSERQAKSPLYVRGHTTFCVGEEADEGGEGSRGTTMMR